MSELRYGLPVADLDHVLACTPGLWEELRGRNLFLTGGTGFFGRWLVGTFLEANERLGLGASIFVLSRNPAGFEARAPELARHPAVRLLAGDVRDFEGPEVQCSHVVHAAADARVDADDAARLRTFETIVGGTGRVLEFARQSGAKKVLLASSGAVYGAQPPELSHLSEDFTGATATESEQAAYGEGKRAAETLCMAFGRAHGLEAKIARCFAFVGPHLPLDEHFAIGNFLRDALGDGPIRVGGDGTPIRSYLYAADLAIWLWTLLFRGRPFHPYNVGSEESRSISEWAHLVAEAAGGRPVTVAQRAKDEPRARYVPATRRARESSGSEPRCWRAKRLAGRSNTSRAEGCHRAGAPPGNGFYRVPNLARIRGRNAPWRTL
ncbi:MAG: NAD-dependent epimerase/dehydratase family protein [Myxococcales bacterium]